MKYMIALLLLGLSVCGYAQSDNVKLERQEIGGKVSVLVPNNFVKLPDNEVAQRYPSSRKPLAVFSNASRSADFGINKGKTVWADADIKLVLDFYKANMQTYYNSISFIKEGVVSEGSLKFAELKFIGAIESLGKGKSRRYVHVRYAVVKNRLYIIQFNCPASEQGLYEGTVNKMMGSVRINKKGVVEQESSGKKDAIKAKPRR